MAIDYKPVGWSTADYINPSNMNQMDNGIKAACDGVDALNIEMDAVDANLGLLQGRDITTTYDDFDSLVIGVHNSLGNHASVCKSYPYSSSTALLIGQRYSSNRGRYLVMPRTSNEIYVYNMDSKDGVIICFRNLLASIDDLPKCKDLSLTFGANKYASIQPEVPSGFAPVSVMSLKEWTNLYLVHRNGNDWSVFGADAGSTISVRIWFAKV